VFFDSSAQGVETGGEEVRLSSPCPSQSSVTDRNGGSGAAKRLFLIYETQIDCSEVKNFRSKWANALDSA
jgi:hypothetical protein